MDSSFIVALRDEEKRIRAEIDHLQNELSVIEKMIQRRSHDSGSRMVLFPEPEQTPEQSVGPLEAVRQALDEAPDKRWTPVELTKRLEDLRRRNQLRSTSAKLASAVHTALKSLLDSGYAVKHKKDRSGVPTYSKAVEPQGNSSALNVDAHTKAQ